MPTEFISAAALSSPSPSPATDDRARSALMLIGGLEASLQSSRKALLALDLAGIERETCEQVRSIRKLEDVLARSMAPPVRGSCATRDGALVSSRIPPELEEELRRSCHRVLEAARLQAALLARARTKLRVLANMLAGQSVTYGPLVAGNSVPSRAPLWNWNSDSKSGGEI